MKTVRMFLIAATAASFVFADTSDAVTKAAEDPSTIPDAVKTLGNVTPEAFATDTINAIASMPKRPVTKVLKMADAAKEFIDTTKNGKLDDMLVALISNVPFEALPAWTVLTTPAVQKEIKELDDKTYQSLVADTVKGIGAIKDFSDDDKAIVTAFALKLLARMSDPDSDDMAFKAGLKALPPAYAKQVEDALPSVFSGDYEAVLGDINIIALVGDIDADEIAKENNETAKTIATDRVPTTATEGTEAYLPAGAEAIAIIDIVKARESKNKKDEPKKKDKKVKKDKGKDKPPVPPPYKEQF